VSQQFADCSELWDELRKFVSTGDFTFGKPLEVSEANFASLMNLPYYAGLIVELTQSSFP